MLRYLVIFPILLALVLAQTHPDTCPVFNRAYYYGVLPRNTCLAHPARFNTPRISKWETYDRKDYVFPEYMFDKTWIILDTNTIEAQEVQETRTPSVMSISCKDGYIPEVQTCNRECSNGVCLEPTRMDCLLAHFNMIHGIVLFAGGASIIGEVVFRLQERRERQRRKGKEELEVEE